MNFLVYVHGVIMLCFYIAFTESHLVNSPKQLAHDEKIVIHVFGSCRACTWVPEMLELCTENNAKLEIHWVGPKLINSFGRDGLNLINVSKYPSILPNDPIVFVFGEIDVRNHVPLFAAKYRFITIINNLVLGYEKAIRANKDLAPQNPIWIAGVGPATRGENMPPGWLSGKVLECQLYTATLNHKLEKMCARNGWTYVDFFEDYVTGDGVLIFDLSGGANHILKYTNSTKLFIAQTLGAYKSSKVAQ